MFCKTTGITGEQALRLSIGLRDMAAFATGSGGVPRIYRNDRDTCELGFVFNILSQLKKSPLPESVSIRPSNRDPKAFKVFKTYSPSGVFSDRDNSFTDCMIGISLESCFSARDFLQASLCIFRAAFLQGAFKTRGLFSDPINMLAGEHISVAGSSNINYSHIDTKNALGVDGRTLGVLDDEAAKKFALAINEGGLPSNLFPFEAGVFANDNRHFLPTINSEDATAIEALERQKALVVNNCRIFLKLMYGLFLNSVRSTDFINSAHDKLRAQFEFFSYCKVAIMVKRNLAKPLVLMGYLRDVITGGIENLHRFQERLILLFGGKKYNFYNKLHYRISIIP